MEKINIETLEISGFRSALLALRLPFNKECRSDVTYEDTYVEHEMLNSFQSDVRCFFVNSDLKLMSTLIKRGNEHAKIMRGIVVHAEIEAPIYFWCELETYIVGHQRLSIQSTMHIDAKGLEGEELVKLKSDIPMCKMLKKIDMFSYQCLRNIYFQRRNHRLPEWHKFCDWIETLPFADKLITIENNNDSKAN